MRLKNLRKARRARGKGKRSSHKGSKSIRKAIRDLKRENKKAKALLRRLGSK